MTEVYIDNAARKRIVTFWVPVCLTVLHIWATILVVAACFFTKATTDGETIRVMFSSCVTGIGCLVLLLISDKALEFVITKVTGGVTPQVIEKTTMEKTTVSTPDGKDKTDG